MKLFATAALAVSLAMPAWAQGVCTSTLRAIEAHVNWGETISSTLKMESGVMLTLWQTDADADAKSWHITASNVTGTAMCIVAAGTGTHEPTVTLEEVRDRLLPPQGEEI